MDEILEIATEAAGELAIAVGGSAARKEKEERRKKKFSLVAPIISIILTLGILYLFIWRLGMIKDFGFIFDEIGYLQAIKMLGLGLSILLIVGLFMMFKNKQKENNKPLKRIYFLLIFSALLTALMVFALYQDIDFTIPMSFIPLIVFTFSIIFMFIMVFDRMKERNLNGIVHMGNALLIRIAIPMMPIWIIFLGAMSSKYNYTSIFLIEYSKGVGINGTVIGGILGKSLYEVFEKIFNMGAARPSLWIFLTIASLLVMIYLGIRTAFFSESWPYGCEEDPESNVKAQQFIDESNDKFISEEDLDAFNRGKLRLNKIYLDNLEEDGKENESD